MRRFRFYFLVAPFLSLLLSDIALFLPIHFASAAALTTDYDPANCKTSAQGKLYLALGRNVLAVIPATAVVVGEIEPSTKLKKLMPPDPTDSIGCPGNPLQLQSYSYLTYPSGLKPNDDAKKTPMRADLVQLIRGVVAEDITPSGESKWIGETGQRDFVDSECAVATIHEKLPSGLEACRLKPVFEARVEDWAAGYIAPLEVYRTPFGGSFAIHCDPGLYTPPAIGHCDAAYVYKPELNVSYRFKPYPGYGAPHVPIDRVIEFDRELRRSLDAALVRNFPWPQQESLNSRSEQKL